VGPTRDQVQLTVTSIDLGGDQIVAPETPLSVDRRAEIYTNTLGGPLATIESADSIAPGDSYHLVALIRKLRIVGGSGTGVTGNQLAAAGTDYPDWVRRYVSIRANSIGPVVQRTANQVLLSLPVERRDPFHLAEAIQDYLYDTGGFSYRTDVRGLCGSERLVDCFLRIKQGYCEYFATTMAMMLRTQGVPTRLAMGYLPGHRLTDGSYEVDRSAAHAWVEVYFPGYGWIRFDPTPGNRENLQQPTRLAAGPAVPTPGPGAQVSPGAGSETSDPLRTRGAIRPGEEPGGSNSTSPGGAGPLAVILPLLLAFAALAVLMWGRARNAPAPEPEVAYRGVARMASRFGYGPRPTQTAYEYTALLSDLVPRVRTDLQYVAHAKVRATYAPRGAILVPLRGLRDAYRRVRLGLLRLALRRRRRITIRTSRQLD
jgi:transglutaminase-like putative cysteine protease